MRILIMTLLMIWVHIFSLYADSRALLVGIGRYKPATGWRLIHGDNDVELLAPVLAKGGYTDVTVLKNSQATKAEIVKELKVLAKRCRKGDKVYFHFSGHGQPVTDCNGDEGKKGYDESIVPYDAFKTVTSRIGDRFYNGELHLTDDELNPLFGAIKSAIGPEGEFFIAIDACYSEDIERAPTEDDAELPVSRGTCDRLNIKLTTELADKPHPTPYAPGARMYVVTACRSDESNFEYRAPDGKLYGALTYFIYTLARTTTDFKTWTERIEVGASAIPGIFQPFQHPQTRIYD